MGISEINQNIFFFALFVLEGDRWQEIIKQKADRQVTLSTHGNSFFFSEVFPLRDPARFPAKQGSPHGMQTTSVRVVQLSVKTSMIVGYVAIPVTTPEEKKTWNLKIG